MGATRDRCLQACVGYGSQRPQQAAEQTFCCRLALVWLWVGSTDAFACYLKTRGKKHLCIKVVTKYLGGGGSENCQEVSEKLCLVLPLVVVVVLILFEIFLLPDLWLFLCVVYPETSSCCSPTSQQKQVLCSPV